MKVPELVSRGLCIGEAEGGGTKAAKPFRKEKGKFM